MKKLIFTLIAVFTFIFFNLSAQVDRNIVILEGGTGVTCPYCPGSAMALEDLYANGDPVAAIEYHNYGNSQFNTPEAAARCSFYAITGYPTMQFDGEWDQYVGGSQTQSMYSYYIPKVTARMAMQTAFTVDLAGSYSGDDYTINIHVEKVGEYSNSNLKVHFVLTESHIPYNWIGMTEVNFCDRIMLPDANGTDITLEDVGDAADVELNFTFNNSWVWENCELIAFVQDNANNKTVLHGDAVMISDLGDPIPTFLAGFYADPTDMCDPGYTQFHADCIGNPISWKWTFQGGYPAVSYDENPEVFYQSVGSYDVTLIISDGVKSDTAFVSKYISVHGKPEVNFADVPELCNEDWDPYELTEGVPAGGVYSGPFVTEGKYFHPTEAGIGEYNITYTYTDEFGCFNSDNTTVTVTSCTGIGDNKNNAGLQVYPNPTQGLMTITIDASMDQAQIRVIDMVGKVVYEQANISVNGSYKAKVDLSTLPQGVYFVTVSGDDTSISKKVFLTK